MNYKKCIKCNNEEHNNGETHNIVTLESLRMEHRDWVKQQNNQDPEFPTNFDVEKWWLQKIDNLFNK